VQDHGIGGNQLLALQPVEQEARRFGEIESRELLLNKVQPLYRPAIVVIVVADDQLLRHALYAGRIAG
jgi:hypothetical protein